MPQTGIGGAYGISRIGSFGDKDSGDYQDSTSFHRDDGCFADGILGTTGATVGHRTLRVEDLGKIAATFTNLKTGNSVRLAPRSDVRTRVLIYAPQEKRRYFAQPKGYQVMPDEELFSLQRVARQIPPTQTVSHQNVRAHCLNCGEEVINAREAVVEGKLLCQTCAYRGYYHFK